MDLGLMDLSVSARVGEEEIESRRAVLFSSSLISAGGLRGLWKLNGP